MKRDRRLVAAIVCVVAVLSLFAASAFLICEAAHPHACTGEGCPVCQFIAQIGQLRRGFALALATLAFLCLALAMRRAGRILSAAGTPALCTPVGRKTRLND